MAALDKSAVTLIDSWYIDGLNSRKFKKKALTVVLTGQGTVANAIPAAALGFRFIYGCEDLVNSANNLIVVGNPSYDRTQLLLKAAGTNAPADYTDTFHVTVWGKP